MPAVGGPPAERTTSNPHEKTKDQKMTPGHLPKDLLEIVKTKVGNPTNLLTNPTGTDLLNKEESNMASAIAAVGKKAGHLIENGIRIVKKKGMKPKVSLHIKGRMARDRSVPTAPSLPIIVLTRKDGEDRIPVNHTRNLTRKALTKQGEESLLLARITQSAVKIRQNKNALPTDLAASGRRSPTLARAM